MDHLVEVSRSLAHLFRYKRCICPSDLIPNYEIDHGVEMYRFCGAPRALLYGTQSKAKEVSHHRKFVCVATQDFSCVSLGCLRVEVLCHVARLQDIATLAASVSKEVYQPPRRLGAYADVQQKFTSYQGYKRIERSCPCVL